MCSFELSLYCGSLSGIVIVQIQSPGWFLVQFILQFTRVPYGVEHPGKFSGLGVTWRSFGTALDRGEHS